MLRSFVHKTLSRLLARPLLNLSAMAEQARRDRLLDELAERGTNVALRPGVTITHPERVRLGDNVMLNHGTMIFAGGGVTVGNDVVVGPGCLILTGNHQGAVFYGSTDLQPVIIGTNVWLGARAIVTPGVTIGSNVIVSAGAVVTDDVPNGTIFAGVPARKIRNITLPFEPRRRRDSLETTNKTDSR